MYIYINNINDLHRMIAFIDTAPAVLPATQCVVQYGFESGRELLVPIKAHGNCEGLRKLPRTF